MKAPNSDVVTGRVARPRRRALRRGSILAAATMAAVVGLAACGGGSSGPGVASGGSTTSPSAVGYSACIRSHGVPNYPDPDSSGQLPKGGAQQFGVSTSQFQAAQQACRDLLPTGGSIQQQEHQCMVNSDCSPALVQQMLNADLKLARCMRSHGVPNFPDPTTSSQGPIFNITKAGISDAASHSNQFEAKLTECGRLVGPNAPESFE
jgi:hypothetical protein